MSLSFLLIFLISSSRRWRSVVFFCIDNCNFNYHCFVSFISLEAISMKMIWFMTFKIMIIFFIFYFCMRALVLRLRFKMISWLIVFFKIIEMSKFVKLLISIKLMFREFVVLLLKIMIIVVFARAIQRDFLHNNFK